MKLLGFTILSFVAHLALIQSSFADAGTYTCENDFVLTTITLDDVQSSYFMTVTAENKTKKKTNEFSGAAVKSVFGEQEITTYSVGNHSLWIKPNNELKYNNSIECLKK